jgi:nucleoside-triphosphatase THEP1
MTLESLGLSIDTLKDMLRRENELRLCSETQEMYRYGSYVIITEGLQRQVYHSIHTLFKEFIVHCVVFAGSARVWSR